MPRVGGPDRLLLPADGRLGRVRAADGGGHTRRAQHRCAAPYGVFACIAPFNFPLALSTGMSSAALVAGNASSISPPKMLRGPASSCMPCIATPVCPRVSSIICQVTGRKW